MPHTIYNLTDHWYPDKIGGSCIYAYKLHQLLSTSVQTETVTLTGEPSPVEENMVVHKVLHKSRFWKNRHAIRQLNQNPNAIWIVHSPWFFLHLFLALGFRVRNQVVAVYHGPWFREYYVSAAAPRNRLAKLTFTLMRYMVEVFYSLMVKRFIFLSDGMYRATAEYLPIAKSKVNIIPMWSEKEAWKVAMPKRGRLTLSTFRRLEPRMGLQDLFHALPRCDLVDYRVLVCGDGPYRRELSELIESLNLQANVQLLGWVSEEEKYRLIQESDAVIIPSKTLEGFSLLALEALECGTPVLLTEAVGFYEYVRDVEQEYVKSIDLAAPELKLEEFLSRCAERVGLDRLKSVFRAEEIRLALLNVMYPSPETAVADRLPREAGVESLVVGS